MQMKRHPQFNMLALTRSIQPLPSQLEAAKMHRTSVRARLEKSFALHSMRPIGSHPRGTAIRTHSDLDLMVVMKKEEALWGGELVSSDTFIRRVLRDLRERFPDSDIRKDGLAATLAFGSTKQSLDVVPAVFHGFNKHAARPVFLIPDGQGGWIETSPAVHDSYFVKAFEASGGKLQKVSQLIKWWKHSRAPSLPIRSFYVDMVLSHHGICSGVKSYGECLFEFFKLLAQSRCAALPDPCGISRRIAAANTTNQQEQLVAAAEYAGRHAASALAAQKSGNTAEANRQWSCVFNGCI